MPLPIRDRIARSGNGRRGQMLSGHTVLEARPLCPANVAKADPETGELGYVSCGERLTARGSGLATWQCKRHGEMHAA